MLRRAFLIAKKDIIRPKVHQLPYITLKRCFHNEEIVKKKFDLIGVGKEDEIDPMKFNPIDCVGLKYWNYKLVWREKPETILIIKKPNDEPTDKALISMIKWLNDQGKYQFIIEPHNRISVLEKCKNTRMFLEEEIRILQNEIDMIITLGGDGSLLHVSSLFNNHVPPIISFSMGTLGFLLPFHIKNFKTDLTKFFNGEITLLRRDRLQCKFKGDNNKSKKMRWNRIETDTIHVVNEINLHRGTYPNLTSINCYVDGLFLTNGVADGLILSTPTGSTAYSLSAGGPIVHPMVSCLLLTPICPRSLSFRPVLLPNHSHVQFKVHPKSRTHAQISLDGKEVGHLEFNEEVDVSLSPYPLLSANRMGLAEDWTHDVNMLLKWNQNFNIF